MLCRQAGFLRPDCKDRWEKAEATLVPAHPHQQHAGQDWTVSFRLYLQSALVTAKLRKQILCSYPVRSRVCCTRPSRTPETARGPPPRVNLRPGGGCAPRGAGPPCHLLQDSEISLSGPRDMQGFSFTLACIHHGEFLRAPVRRPGVGISNFFPPPLPSGK